MEDTNIVCLVARLTSDPELRTLASGTTICSMRVAFNTSQKTDGGWEDKGNFVNVTVWGGHGETCAKFLTKGQRVAINGRLQWREWESDAGKRSEVSITGNRVQFLDPPSDTPKAAAKQAAPATPDTDTVPF